MKPNIAGVEPPGGLRASARYGGLAMTPREALRWCRLVI